MEKIGTARKTFISPFSRLNALRLKAVPYADVFYFAFFCFLINCKSTFIEYTDYLELHFLLAGACLAVKYLFTDWQTRDVPVCAGLFLLGYLSYALSGHTIMLITIAGIIGAKGVDLKHLVTWLCFFRVAQYIALVALFNMSLVPRLDETSYGNTTYVNGEAVQEVLHRYNLGFTKANPAHIVFFICVAAYVYCRYEKFNLVHGAAITVINFCLYDWTNCRTGVWLVEIVVVLALLFKIKKVYRLCGRLIPHLLWIAAAFCLVVTLTYDRFSFAAQIDSALSLRFSYSDLFMSNFSATLFGADVSAIEADTAFDVAYFNLFLNYGVILFVLYLVGNTLLLRRSVTQNNPALSVALIAFVILGVTENYSLDIAMNFTLVFLSVYLFPSANEGGMRPWRKIPCPRRKKARGGKAAA